MNWHTLTVDKTFELLFTNSQGLSTLAADEKLRLTGPNELQEGKKKSILGKSSTGRKKDLRQHSEVY